MFIWIHLEETTKEPGDSFFLVAQRVPEFSVIQPQLRNAGFPSLPLSLWSSEDFIQALGSGWPQTDSVL